MELVIETNLIISINNEIIDHQSRVVEVESWESYIDEIDSGKSVYRTSYIGSAWGRTLPIEQIPSNVDFNEYHGRCVIDYNGFKIQKLFYRVR